eukprot:TRINITY_DN909_c0_g5_i1.p1 TRINITY_DN909_c0_g5~~TRINITY_DN909_c0_g5_i1.p1  ORF type:complete len:1925 (+),score=515.08 TRINITY_DN909_c0_g5_i1:120-5894(+)
MKRQVRVAPAQGFGEVEASDDGRRSAARAWTAESRVDKRQCTLLDGKQVIRLHDEDYRITGDYFTDISFKEREFVVTEVSLRSHPDSVLRESGIIKQTGRYGSFGHHEVTYDAKLRRWVYSNKATLHKLGIDGDSLMCRKDTPPTGVIRIVGEIHFHKFQMGGAKAGQVVRGQGGLKMARRPSLARRRSVQEEPRQVDHDGYEELMDSGDERNANETTALGEAGDEDNSFMSDLEVSKHIRQYLSRALPALVTQSGFMVLHSGVGAVAHQLSKGMAVYEALDPDDDDDEDDDEIEQNHKQHPGACVCVVPTSQRHSVKQHFTHCVLLRRDTDLTRGRITNHEVISFINRLVESLSEGLSSNEDKQGKKGSRNTGGMKKPPPRSPVPCCALLIGGDPTFAPMELMQSVTRRDPVIVVQGSKGYADMLCDIIDAVQDYNPNAGRDDFQKFLNTADALTEQIIMTYVTGKLIVIKKGTKVEEFQRQVHSCLRGDEALKKAWMKYAQWSINVAQQQSVYTIFNGMILFLSICATLTTVVMTFTRLMWQIEGRAYPEVWNQRDPTASEMGHYSLYFLLTWATIGFPILLALVQAVYNKVNPSSKLVALRVAAEDVLRQIYMYRTRTLDYSAEKCKEHDPSSPGYVTGSDGLVYSTREELLAFMVNQNTDKLSRSPVANVALSTYLGTLPPKDIREYDSGFHDLSPDEYIDIRLRKKRKQLQEQSSNYQLQSNIVNVSIHCCSGVGTCLAAIAANGYGYLHTWIALTTALVNCLQRYSDFSNLTKMHEQYNKTDNNLSNVEIWFAKLGESKDGTQNRNQLVKKTEEHINEEVETWARLLQSVAARMKGLDDGKDTGKKREQMKAKEKKEQAKMKEIGFDGLSQENFKQALENPQSAQAKQLYQSLAKLNDDLGDQVKTTPNSKTEKKPPVKAKPPPSSAPADQPDSGQAVDEKSKDLREVGILLRSLPSVPKRFAEVANAHNVSLALEELVGSKERPRGLSIANAQCVSHQRLLSMLSDVPALGKVLMSMTQREFLECMKGLVLHYVLEQLFSPPDKIRVRVRDVTPSAAYLEDFLNEMYVILIKTQGIDPKKPEMVLAQVRDEAIRDSLTKLQQDQLSALFSGAQELLQSAGAATSSPRHLGTGGSSSRDLSTGPAIMLQLLENCSCRIAELDVESVMENVDERLALWRELKDLPRSAACTLETMNRGELLNILPTRFRALMQHRSVFQIAAAISVLQAGTPASRVFESLLSRPRETLPELSASLFDDPAVRERFVMASELLTQDVINRKTKGDLIRMLRLHKSFTNELSDFVNSLSDAALKKILSHIQALFSNGYAGRVMDRLNDELSFFDIKGLLSIEEREKLVGKLREFRDLQPKLAKMNKAQLLSAIGYPRLQAKLGKLSHEQLSDLVFTLTWVLKIARQQRLWKRLCVAMVNRTRADTVTQRSSWGPVSDEVVDHMFTYARGMRTKYSDVDPSHVEFLDMEKFKRDEKPTRLLSYVGDSLLTSALLNTPPKEILDMLRLIHKTFGDPLVSDVFELVGSGIRSSGNESQHAKYASLFLIGHAGSEDTAFDEDKFYHEPQRRRYGLLKAVQAERVRLKEVHEVRTMPSTTLQNCLQANDDPDVEKEVRGLLNEMHSAGLDAVEVQDIVARILSELVVSLPMRVFRLACDKIESCDVRGLLSQLPVRYLSASLIFLLMHRGEIEVDPDTGAVTETKKRIIQVVRKMPDFTQTCSALRDFSEAQLQEFATVVRKVLLHSPGGQFFCSYCEGLLSACNGDVSAFVQRQLINLGVTIFKNKIRTSMGQCTVKQMFCDWDANRFVAQKQNKEKLQQFLEDDDMGQLFDAMKVDQVENVFAHLRPLDSQHIDSENDPLGEEHIQALLGELTRDTNPEYSDDGGGNEREDDALMTLHAASDTMSNMYSDDAAT